MNDFIFEFNQGKSKWNEGRWKPKGLCGQFIDDNKLFYVEGDINYRFLDENGYQCPICKNLSIQLKIKNISRHKLNIEFDCQILINNGTTDVVIEPLSTLSIDNTLANDGEQNLYIGDVKLKDLKDEDTIKLKVTNIKITQKGKNYITTFFIPENSDDSSSED